MNKKSIAALAVAATMTFGIGASSYAWFTSTATSQQNKFQAGTLGVVSSIDNPKAGSLNFNNLAPGYSSAPFTYTVNNIDKNGNNSSLDLLFKNEVIGKDDTTKQYDTLLEVATFDIAVTGTAGAKLSDGTEVSSLNAKDINFAKLTEKLNTVVKLTGGSLNSVTYTITPKLPEVLTANNAHDNEYQGVSGEMTITAGAYQTNYKTPAAPASK